LEHTTNLRINFSFHPENGMISHRSMSYRCYSLLAPDPPTLQRFLTASPNSFHISEHRQLLRFKPFSSQKTVLHKCSENMLNLKNQLIRGGLKHSRFNAKVATHLDRWHCERALSQLRVKKSRCHVAYIGYGVHAWNPLVVGGGKKTAYGTRLQYIPLVYTVSQNHMQLIQTVCVDETPQNPRSTPGKLGNSSTFVDFAAGYPCLVCLVDSSPPI
jgi:hypothetical protein